jgi:hypothetical protein
VSAATAGKLRRVDLHGDRDAPFAVPPGTVARVWIAHDDGGRPHLWAGDGIAVAVVVVWPTDSRGRLDAGALRRGEVTTRRWDLTPPQLERLRELDRPGWGLFTHDVFVDERGHIGPALDTASAAAPAWGVALAPMIGAAAARLEAAP